MPLPLIPIAILGGLGYIGWQAHKKAPTTNMQPVVANPIPPGYSAPSQYNPPAATPVLATYTVAPRDLLIMVASRFTIGMRDWLKANPHFYDGTSKDYNSPGPNQANNFKYYSPDGAGFKDIALVQSAFFPVGKTWNLPPNARDNGVREMATGSVKGIVAQGITKEMVPNPPGTTEVQATLIREAMSKALSTGQSQDATSARIADILKNITR